MRVAVGLQRPANPTVDSPIRSRGGLSRCTAVRCVSRCGLGSGASAHRAAAWRRGGAAARRRGCCGAAARRHGLRRQRASAPGRQRGGSAALRPEWLFMVTVLWLPDPGGPALCLRVDCDGITRSSCRGGVGEKAPPGTGSESMARAGHTQAAVLLSVESQQGLRSLQVIFPEIVPSIHAISNLCNLSTELWPAPLKPPAAESEGVYCALRKGRVRTQNLKNQAERVAHSVNYEAVECSCCCWEEPGRRSPGFLSLIAMPRSSRHGDRDRSCRRYVGSEFENHTR
jgi:hypothetical protein